MTGTVVRHSEQEEWARKMVEFLVCWAPFDGGEEEIMPTFGLMPADFYARAARCLQTNPGLLAGWDVRDLVAYCIRKSGGGVGVEGARGSRPLG